MGATVCRAAPTSRPRGADHFGATKPTPTHGRRLPDRWCDMVVLESRERDFAIPFRLVEVDDSGATAERSGRTCPPQASEAVRRRIPGLVHVAVRESASGLSARCVEFDIVGEGDTKQEAIDSVFGLLRDYVLAAIELDEVEQLIPPPAPERHALTLNAHEATRRIRRRLSPPPSTANAENILARFGACNSQAGGDATWERPFPGGGTRCVPVPRDRLRLARETLGSIIRHSGIHEDDWWRAASDRNWPPPIRRRRDALGLTNGEIAPMLSIHETGVDLMCSGERAPGYAASVVLAELDRLCAGVAAWDSPRGRVWKLMRDPHPACGGARPVDALGELRDIAELRRVVNQLLRRRPPLDVEHEGTGHGDDDPKWNVRPDWPVDLMSPGARLDV